MRWPTSAVAAPVLAGAVLFAGLAVGRSAEGVDCEVVRAASIDAPSWTQAEPEADFLVVADLDQDFTALEATVVANLLGHQANAEILDDAAAVEHRTESRTGVVVIGGGPTTALGGVASAAIDAGVPVVWVGRDLVDSLDAAGARHDWEVLGERSPPDELEYRGVSLTAAGDLPIEAVAAVGGEVLAVALMSDGSSWTWAQARDGLVHVAGSPVLTGEAMGEYLVLADLLLDLGSVEPPTDKRAMVRLEDVGPRTVPEDLDRMTEVLVRLDVPFSFGVYPEFHSPPNGEARFELADSEEVVSSIKRMICAGGVPILHGLSHQYGTLANPYDGTSGGDFEFYLAEESVGGDVVLLGPVEEDSEAWVGGRMAVAERLLAEAALPVPSIWEFPHYAASANGYAAVADRYAARFDRGMYFVEEPDAPVGDTRGYVTQPVPYPVMDVYGSVVIPETMGHVAPEAYNQHPSRSPADLLAAAEEVAAVRGGIASFFYHPFLGPEMLEEMIAGLRDRGFEFVSPLEV